MHQPTFDLFGQVPVSQLDIDAWLIAVPGQQPGTQRARHYVLCYRVADKVAAAKIRGDFDAITAPREHLAYWWQRLAR